jgi:hypothetical protein
VTEFYKKIAEENFPENLKVPELDAPQNSAYPFYLNLILKRKHAMSLP